jgi:hypothetical protein
VDARDKPGHDERYKERATSVGVSSSAPSRSSTCRSVMMNLEVATTDFDCHGAEAVSSGDRVVGSVSSGV